MTALLTKVSHSEAVDSVHIVTDSEPGAAATSFVSLFVERSFVGSPAENRALTEQQFPLLADIWDNEADAAYDDL